MSEEKKATPSEELRRQFMDHSTPLNEAGHWARRRIEQLESELRRKETDLHEGEHKVSDFNEPVTEAEWWAKGRIEQLEAENKRLCEALARISETLADVLDGSRVQEMQVRLGVQQDQLVALEADREKLLQLLKSASEVNLAAHLNVAIAN